MDIKSVEFERTIKHDVHMFSAHPIWSVAIRKTYLPDSDVSKSFFNSNKFGKSLMNRLEEYLAMIYKDYVISVRFIFNKFRWQVVCQELLAVSKVRQALLKSRELFLQKLQLWMSD